jgi:hypothetical protein
MVLVAFGEQATNSNLSTSEKDSLRQLSAVFFVMLLFVNLPLIYYTGVGLFNGSSVRTVLSDLFGCFER